MHRGRGIVLASVLLVAAAGGLTALSVFDPMPPETLDERLEGRPLEVKNEGYAGSDTCRACHPREYASWRNSYHRTMTQLATADTVLADLDGLQTTVYGQPISIQRRDDDFWLQLQDPNWGGPGPGPRVERKIVMTTGSHHEQMYWYATGNTRKVGLLPLVYILEQDSLLPFHSVVLQPTSERWSWEGGQWNYNCIRCHATRGRAGFQNTAVMHTNVVEFGIACEACHGPAQEHISANRDPLRRYGLHLDSRADPSIVQPGRLSHRRASEVCGQCHSVSTHHTEDQRVAWFKEGFHYQPGDELARTRYLVRGYQDLDSEAIRMSLRVLPTMMEDHFWSDGMVRISGREYSGLLETPCFQSGEMSCSSCHAMHQASNDSRSPDEWRNDQLKVGMDENPACLQCHTELDSEQKLIAHSHHPAESQGSLCYNCHMPYTTYGLLKTIRSHQVDSPAVAVSLKTGRPNACNLCHLDRTLAWTSRQLEQWYGQRQPALGNEQNRYAASVLWALSGDAGQRAILAAALSWPPALEAAGMGWIAPILAPLLNDPYDAVRIIAYRSLKRLPGFADFDFDPLVPEEQRKAAVQRASDRWHQFQLVLRQQSGENVKRDPAINLDQAQIDRLWLQRDPKRVFLRE